MTVQIRLRDMYTINLTRDEIVSLKGSLLSQSLGDDTVISLDNPIIQPGHLDLLAKMARQEEIKPQPCNKAQHQAAVYLNWPLLSVVQNPKYASMQKFAPYCHLYRPETFGSVLPWSVA